MYLVYGILLGLSPLFIGTAIAKVQPHSAWALVPWVTLWTFPIGFIVGLILTFTF